MSEHPEQNLSVVRNMKIGLFHLGSGMADVIITGVWNRVMISDLGYAATPVSLLTSLRYFLAPLGVWAGRVSDRRSVAGFRRMFWIGLGRAMMVISTLLLGLSTASLVAGGGAAGMAGKDGGQWLLIGLAMLLFSLGGAISGSTFLALIYDRAPESQRGRAVGIVWTFLLFGFAIGGATFGVMLPHREARALRFSGGVFELNLSSLLAGVHPISFTAASLQNLFLIAGVAMGLIWLFSMLFEERRSRAGETYHATGQQEYSTSVVADLRLALSNRSMRFFLFYLTLSMFFAFSQDLILEPFGGQVFNMSANVTTRFTSYWASTAIVGTIIFLFLSRRYKSLNNTLMSNIGVGFLVVAFAVFTLSAFAQIRPLVTIGLMLLGVGLGIWNVGTTGLMMDMSPSGRAGTFLGFWTLVVTLARGGGVSAGGIVRDLGLNFTGSLPVAYGIAFLLGTIGLVVSLWALRQANIRAFKAQQIQLDTATVLAGAMD